MTQGQGAPLKGQALVSDGAASVSTLTGFDPSRKDAILAEMTRIIALHGLATIDGRTRQMPPNDKWTVDEWRKRVLDCIPVLAEVRCATLASVLYALATEAGTAETPQSGSVHEGAGPQDNAHSTSPIRE